MGCPVLSEKRQELRSAFVGVKQPCTVECVDVRGAGDQVGEPVQMGGKIERSSAQIFLPFNDIPKDFTDAHSFHSALFPQG